MFTHITEKRGFTLIELLVVIAIIGILSSVVLASLNTARQKSRDAKRISDIGQIQLALELYFDTNGDYPDITNDSGLTGLTTPVAYLPIVPTPPSGVTGVTTYFYVGTGGAGNCSSYHLGAALEQTGIPVLASDDDGSGATVCAGGTEFNGNSPACTLAVGTEGCYDVTP